MNIRQKVFISTMILFLFTYLSKTTVFAENISNNEVGTVTAKVLNLRQSPNTSSKIITKIKYGEKVKIIENIKGWHRINFNSKEGWISSNYIKISKSEEKAGKVNVDILKVRKEPNTSAVVVSKLEKGKTFQILNSSKNWYSIKTSDGITGWVCGDYVTLIKPTETRKSNVDVSRSVNEELKRTESEEISNKNEEVQRQSDSEELTIPKDKEITPGDSEEFSNITNSEWKTDIKDELPASNEGSLTTGSEEENLLVNQQTEITIGQQIIDYAKNFIGVKYKYGGNTPEEGFDCSGFTKYVYSNFKIDIERTAASQGLQGYEIKKEELSIGDLVFFDTTGSGKNINHVGIYIGEGNFIHAASPKYNVTITSLSDTYYMKYYVTSRRIINL